MPDAVDSQVKEMIVERCFLSIAPGDIGDDADLMDEVGLDSIQILEVVVGLEETFGVSFEDADFDIENFRSVRAIAGFVRDRTNG
jgi:acyl carrier protein